MNLHYEAIDRLKKMASSNPAADAMFHAFAIRKRARNNVSFKVLKRKMQREGFNYPDEQYAEALKSMANLGFGRLEIDAKGRVKALKDIRHTLQSIGQAACGKGEVLMSMKKRNKFSKIAAAPNPELSSNSNELPNNSPKTPLLYPIILTFSINDKAVIIPIPKEFTPEDTAELIRGIQKAFNN